MWDDVYSTEQYVYGREPNEFLRDNYTSIPMGRVLCLAEGEGRNAVYLAGLGYQVTAGDASKVGLMKAERLALEKGVEIDIVHADLATFNLGEHRWDGVVSIFCHLPPMVRKTVHQGVERSLKPGGALLLEAYTPRQLENKTGGPPVPELMLSKDILKTELPGLVFNHLQELDRDVTEGSKHLGLGSVVQAIGSPGSRNQEG